MVQRFGAGDLRIVVRHIMPNLMSVILVQASLSLSTAILLEASLSFLGIGAQSRLDHRYLTEDVGYSLVFLTDLARRIGVPTPTMEALITMASIVLARDLRTEGSRTLATLGLDELSVNELAAL